MTDLRRQMNRRAFLGGFAAAGAALPLAGVGALATSSAASAATSSSVLSRPIPGTAERLPAIGMGSWITFNVGDDQAARDVRVRVLGTFFGMGGAVIDSSPMYGSSEEVIGHCLGRLGHPDALFSATKVWTPLQWHGVRQMRNSEALWGETRFDLMQIHNLLSWEKHLETLLERKSQGRLRYIGVTTSHGRRHRELERVMAGQPIDFAQFTYNVVDREAERRLLPLAAERGLGVIVNRPFRRGGLFERVAGRPLPSFAAEFDCANWAQFFLKFIVSHPAVTCAIPATSRVDHMQENMGALRGRLPDAPMRARMARVMEGV